MCYFSNPAVRREKHGKMTETQLNAVARSMFPHTLKLQIGCGAEPTLDKQGCLQLVTLGKQYGVPYISLTTNGVLLTSDSLEQLVAAGLDELTISLHGILRDTYERLMGATSKYDAFLYLLSNIRIVKQQHPKFNVRINYTMNADNVDELADFDSLFADVPIDQLQLRPIRKIGESEYTNFDLTHIEESMDTIIKPLSERCQNRGMTVLIPDKIHIDKFAKRQHESARSQLLSMFTYHYVGPSSYSVSDIDYEHEDYPRYSKRHRIGRHIWQGIWRSERKCAEMSDGLKNALNYDIR